MSAVDTRHLSRSSLFQMASVRLYGTATSDQVKVRNLSDTGVMVQGELLAEVGQRLQAVRAFAALPEAAALAAANKRIGNILKKSEGEGAAVQESLLVEAAEQGLFAAMQATVPAADAEFANGDYTASLMTLAALRVPVDAFFDGVMVNAEDAALKANRLGLLKNLHEAMNRVADLSRLAA